MQIVNKLCEKISDNISEQLDFDKEKRDVINYGIFAFLQMSISIFLVVIVGLIFGVMVESIIISFTVSILRKSSGGAHANSPEKCAVIGTVFCVALALIVRYVNIRFDYLIILQVIILLGAYYFVNKLAPVDSKNKPIRSVKKRARLKKTSLLILSLYALVIFINIIFFIIYKQNVLLKYSLCICMGILWQVFSLTKVGHIVLGWLG